MLTTTTSSPDSAIQRPVPLPTSLCHRGPPHQCWLRPAPLSAVPNFIVWETEVPSLGEPKQVRSETQRISKSKQRQRAAGSPTALGARRRVVAGKLRSLAGESPLPPPPPRSLCQRSLGQTLRPRAAKAPPRRGFEPAQLGPRQSGAGRRGHGVAGSAERARPSEDPGSRQRAAPGAEGRSPLRPYFLERRHSPPGTRSVEAAPAARVHAAPPATAASVWALGPAPRRPAARAAAAAHPARGSGGTRGGRGTGGLPRAPGRGVPERTPAAGGARGAALLQLPCGLAQRPASAGRRAGGPRHGECPGDTAAQRVGRTPVRVRPSAPRSTTLGEMGRGPRRLRSGQAVQRLMVAQSPQGAGWLVRRF